MYSLIPQALIKSIGWTLVHSLWQGLLITLIAGALIVATFADDGPTHCSGLPVIRYSTDELADAFSEHFALIHCERELQHTPSGAVQPFTWVVLRRES